MSLLFKKVEPSLTFNEVLAILKYEKSWLYGQMKAGKFPKPDRKVGKKNLWSREAIEQYLAMKAIEESNNSDKIYNWSGSAMTSYPAIPCTMTFKF
jgi:predicted DNA-binding transcriptional regulator AlpA